MPVANPKTVEEFLRKPTWEEWEAELDAGWTGPDGSSWSFDKVLGIVIGMTSAGYNEADLAANRHDWYYRLGRRLRLPDSYRKAADQWYRDRIIEQVEFSNNIILLPLELSQEIIKRTLRIARLRYWGLRLFGRHAWKAEARPPGGWPMKPRKMGARKWKKLRREQIKVKWDTWKQKVLI